MFPKSFLFVILPPFYPYNNILSVINQAKYCLIKINLCKKQKKYLT
nr:MAG TPA: hypothetical protein [Caudoviricetes sp.]DAX99500.1 MAG TPA: hypothetical protein [Caudoviricetes sp.]